MIEIRLTEASYIMRTSCAFRLKVCSQKDLFSFQIRTLHCALIDYVAGCVQMPGASRENVHENTPPRPEGSAFEVVLQGVSNAKMDFPSPIKKKLRPIRGVLLFRHKSNLAPELRITLRIGVRHECILLVFADLSVAASADACGFGSCQSVRRWNLHGKVHPLLVRACVRYSY